MMGIRGIIESIRGILDSELDDGAKVDQIRIYLMELEADLAMREEEDAGECTELS
jgi:hypothetical protein